MSVGRRDQHVRGLDARRFFRPRFRGIQKRSRQVAAINNNNRYFCSAIVQHQRTRMQRVGCVVCHRQTEVADQTHGPFAGRDIRGERAGPQCFRSRLRRVQ